MAERLALLGAAEGPWCSIDLVRNPKLRISGSAGAEVRAVTIQDEDKAHHHKFQGDGMHTFGDLVQAPVWIKLYCDKPNPKLVCTVIPSKVTDAILST